MNVTAMLPSILKSSSVQHFCSHPVPDYYILRYIKHEVTALEWCTRQLLLPAVNGIFYICISGIKVKIKLKAALSLF